MAPDPERQEILELMALATGEGSLPLADEARLRGLLSHHVPSARTLPWDALVRAGHITLGVWVTFEPDTLQTSS